MFLISLFDFQLDVKAFFFLAIYLLLLKTLVNGVPCPGGTWWISGIVGNSE